MMYIYSNIFPKISHSMFHRHISSSSKYFNSILWTMKLSKLYSQILTLLAIFTLLFSSGTIVVSRIASRKVSLGRKNSGLLVNGDGRGKCFVSSRWTSATDKAYWNKYGLMPFKFITTHLRSKSSILLSEKMRELMKYRYLPTLSRDNRIEIIDLYVPVKCLIKIAAHFWWKGLKTLKWSFLSICFGISISRSNSCVFGSSTFITRSPDAGIICEMCFWKSGATFRYSGGWSGSFEFWKKIKKENNI